MTEEEKEDLRLDLAFAEDELDRLQCVLISAKEKLKRVDPLSDEFEDTYSLIRVTKTKMNQLAVIRLKCNMALRGI